MKSIPPHRNDGIEGDYEGGWREIIRTEGKKGVMADDEPSQDPKIVARDCIKSNPRRLSSPDITVAVFAMRFSTFVPPIRM
jgi:hypothetical protein